MSQHPSYPPNYNPVYPGGPAQVDWRAAYGYPPGGPAPGPGILTAVGVISIIVAAIALLGSGFTALAGLGLFQIAKMTTTWSSSSASGSNAPVQGMAANPVPAGQQTGNDSAGSPPTGSPRTAEPTGRGMGRTDRATVLTALGTLEEMTDGQKKWLDVILSQQGLDFFPQTSADSTPTLLTRADVIGDVKNHSTLPSPDPSEEDPVYFNTALGHLELHDDRALFRFADPTIATVRTTPASEVAADPTPPPAPAQTPTPAPAGPSDPFAAPASSDPFANPDSAATQPAAVAVMPVGSALSPAQIATVVQKVQAAAGNKLNPAQVAAISAALAKPDQHLVTPATLWSPVSMAVPQPDGSVVIKMNGGYVFIDAGGTITDQTAGAVPKVRMNPMPIALVIGESVASLALAVFLLLSGIFMLRESPRGRRLHQIFALIKIPLAVIAIAAFSWMMADWAGNIRPSSGGRPPRDGFAGIGMLLAGAGLIYPIIVLIVMHLKSVRDYYRTMSISPWDV